MRADCEADLGAFHGRIAKSEIHWLNPSIGANGAWITWDADKATWRGYDAATGGKIDASHLDESFEPWTRALNDDAPPIWRWFEGGLTNSCFNEVDRHVLAGHGEEAALIFEGDRWDASLNEGKGGPLECYEISRKKLLLETAKCAIAFESLGAKAGDRVAFNMPNVPEQIFWTAAAKRLGLIYTPVFGGFSDKTLSDRIENSGAGIIVTVDGAYRNAQAIPYKTAYTDPALDNFIPVAEAQRLVDQRLAKLSLDDTLAREISSGVADAVRGETTVERGDIMRGVGRALASFSVSGELPASEASRVRTEIAEALVGAPARVKTVIVERHAPEPNMVWRDERDQWADDLKSAALNELLSSAREAGFDVATEDELLTLPDADFVRAIWARTRPRPVDAEYPMFIIYTSGSTGKPKGVVHVHGGYTAGVAHTMKIAFDANPGDVIYVVADPGWITGQSYLISAPLTTRVTTVIAEGAPVYPHAGRFASIIERHGVHIFKAGVTFLKTVMQDPQSVEDVRKYDLSGLRAATFCAEPTSPPVQEFGMREVTPWYANSYWATEHGGIAWTHFYGNSDYPLLANAHAYPLPWIFGDVWVESDNNAIGDRPGAPTTPYSRDDANGIAWRGATHDEKGEIVITAPYPYLARTIWGDAERFKVVGAKIAVEWRGDAGRYADTYWRRWKGVWAYTQGDFGKLHPDASFSIHGRSDDVINVSGHRLGTEEIEGAILRDKAINPIKSPIGNVIVVGAPHRDKGLTPLAFVTPTPGGRITHEDRKRLSDLVRTEKGALAIPSDFIEVSAFPETRSGKYMRRMVRALVEDGPIGDVTTLKNPESLDEIKRAIDDWRRRQSASDSQRIFERYRYFRIQYNALDETRKVATVFVSNPPVNALNERALDELNTVVEHLQRREDVFAVVFTGDGSSSFVAGADIRQFLEEMNTGQEARALPNKAHAAFRRIEQMAKPTIAAVQGVALGGGMEFALACQYRIAEPYARLGQPEIRLRLLPGYGGTQRLPRLLSARRGEAGLIDALEMILGGRSIDGASALDKGIVDELAGASTDVLSLAHQRIRELAQSRDASALGAALAAQNAFVASMSEPASNDLDEALEDAHVSMIVRQAAGAGRKAAVERCLDAIRTGWRDGVEAGFAREAALFAEAVIDPVGGKTGIREFNEKRAKPLPIRRDGVRLYGEDKGAADDLMAQGELLPIGAPFFPGVTKLPKYQFAFGVPRDPETGAPRFGAPKDAEVQLVAPTPKPGPNDALVYVLASEVNFNDIWAITGIPVSAFDSHEEDIQITGSGGVALVAALGEEAREEGRLKVGDLVAIYSGTSDLLSPAAGNDPMYADFSIQGYETPTGSHAQFLVTQAPQLHPFPSELTLDEAGAYTLNLGTVVRALFTRLQIQASKRIFVEGASTGTGLDALRSSISAGLKATGLVSTEERAEAIQGHGAVGAINRKHPDLAELFTAVPEDPEAAREWERDGAPLLDAYRAANDGELADFAVSHAGETAFPRTFQLLAEGGVLAFYGASSGYHFTFVGKSGAATPQDMLARAKARGDESVLIFYGPATSALVDEAGLEMIEATRLIGAKTVVVTATDGQREFVLSLGFEDAVAGVVSLETLKRRGGAEFEWPVRMPRLPDAKADIEAFKTAVRDFQERTMKPFGSAIGKILRSPDNPRGAPDIVLERACFDSLGITSALVKPFTGRVVYSESMESRRYSFYAPQVWTRQRNIIMPTAEIRGTHLCNAYEVTRMNDMIAAGMLEVTPPTVVRWTELPNAHQAMWENRHAGATYLVNHALPETGLRGRDALYEAWSSAQQAKHDTSGRE
ncbi:MAG: AMP-binding protein [Pseudomonadota bacterium]